MTAGERNERDYQAYPPYGSDGDRFAGADGGLGAEPSGQPGGDPPAEQPWAGHAGDYPAATYPAAAGPQPAYGEPAYGDPGHYGDVGGWRIADQRQADYPGAGAHAAGYRESSYRGDYYPEPGPEGYSAAGYPGSGHSGAGYAQPDYAQPDYAQPDYGQPGYPQPGYVQPGYPPPGYPAGGYAPPGDYQRGYPESGYPVDDYPTAVHQPTDGRRPGMGTGPRTGSIARHRMSRDRAGGHSTDGGPGRSKRRGLPLWQELPLLLVIAFCLAILVRTFLLQAFYIPSGSMEDTLIAGDRVLVNKVVYNFREPARGEVLVFKGTDAWAPIGAEDEDIGTFATIGRTLGDLVGISRPGVKDYIKRVVALPGDTVSCCDVDGRVFVNGQPLDEDYVLRNSPLDDVPPDDCRGRRFEEVVVQPGQMFVMGDHRVVSQDSRCQGQVPIENVIGRAFVIVWPSDRWAGLSQPEIFTAAPQPASVGPIDPIAPIQLAFVLPILFSLGATFRGDSVSFRLIGRAAGRRLAE